MKIRIHQSSLWVSSLAILFVTASCLCAFELKLLDGRALRDIVIAPDAPDSVKFAANELADGLEKRIGNRTKLHEDGALLDSPAIYLGISDATQKLGITAKDAETPQTFTIRTLKNGLAIFGKDYSGPPIVGIRDPWHAGAVWNPKHRIQMFGDCGTMDGVHFFMQKYLGFRWYMPGELGEVVPQQSDVTLHQITETHSPDFTYRYPYYCWFKQSDEGAIWFKRMRLGGSVPLQLNHIFKNPMFFDAAKGHPEYFALVDGVRDETGRRCSSDPQYCLTNPEVVQLFAKAISKYFDEHPEMTTFPVCPGDGLRRVCECPNCAKEVKRDDSFETGGFSYHIWNFVNKVAHEVRKTHPDKFIVGAAYHQHGDCPDIPLEPNVMVLITKRRSGYLNPYYKEFNRKRFDDWNKYAPGRIFCWDYYLDTDVPWRNLPVQFTKLIAEDLKYLKSLNVKGEFIECSKSKGTLGFPGMTHLNLYVTSQLFWDVNQDLAAMLDEYYDLFYGPARVQMKEFWETAENRRNESGPRFMNANARSIRTALPPGEVYPPAVIQRMSELLAKAVAATADGSIYRRRVELVKSEFDLGAKALAAMMDIKAKETIIDDKFGEYEEFVAKTGEAFDVKTGMAAAINSEFLTLRFICQEPLMDKLDRTPLTKDSKKAWNQEGIEIFIVPDADKLALDRAYQLYVTASASIIDYERYEGRILSTYNINADAKVEYQPSRWILTLKLPRKEIGLEDDKPFLANFYRYRHFGDIAKDRVHSCWSPTGERLHFCPEKYGKFIIGTPRRPEVKNKEAIVRPHPTNDIVTGNTSMTFWMPGGSIGGKSPIVGNINGTRRNDLVLLRLPLGAFLDKGSVQKAVFSVKGTIYGDKKRPISCALEYINDIDDRLQRADLGREGLEKIGDIALEAQPKESAIKTFDVTSHVNDALANGRLALKFRFKDPIFTNEANAGRKSPTHSIYLSDFKLTVTP